ncbi:MAG: cell wall metabolism sensor histidine kinase WalK [Chloroflexi bacterium]|nr:cell wall metabolism sensor histidine kinase WalK [Chloroflexota bacterium]MBU1748953.1 cell wall metabolism sensor histidine kinase WalK [Chloroflexota bacterium]
MFHIHSIRWRIAIPYILLILLTMTGLGMYLSDLVRSAYLADLQAQLTAEARLVADVLAPALAPGEPGATFDVAARRYADLLGARVTIIGLDGTVLGESHEDRTQMDNHLLRPEVQQALDGGPGSSIRYSRTVGYDMLYVAVPMPAAGQTVGIARVALPLRQIQNHVTRLQWTILLAALLAGLGATGLAVFIAARTARPIHQLTEVVQQMTAGDLDARLLPVTADEVGTLAQAFNQMADRLRDTITTLTEERGRLDAVLDNLADGVVITNGAGRIRLINPAAARLLGTDTASALGRSFAQVARDHRIIDLWQQCVAQCAEQASPVELDRQRLFLHVVVAPQPGAEPGTCLVILQDLTRVRRLETVRRDFISNISHELRTPLASLKALVDTLRDGALADPPAAQRFLNHMDRELDALTQMVRELLELARIESGQVPFRLAPTPVADVVLPAVERLRPQADRAGLQLTVDLPADLPPVLADAERIRQVVTNLVHNALKFTPAGGAVSVTATAGAGEVVIAVRDTGVGIPAEDLARIFERFYKADRARAGGGTGLGLAIAKHIVQGHDGRIWVESREGQGSTFRFALPIAG